MTPDELRSIISQWDKTVAEFAALLHVTERTVYRWLEGKPIRPSHAAFIRTLSTPTKEKPQ